MVSLGSTPGAIAMPSGRRRHSSIISTTSRSTATVSLSATIRGMARNGHAWPSPSRPGSQRNVPAWRSGSWKASLDPAASGARASSGSAADAPSTPRQCSASGAGSSFPTKISYLLAALRLLIETGERPDRRCRSVRAQGEAAGRGGEGGAWLRQPARRQCRAQCRGPQSGDQSASIQREFCTCHRPDPDHFCDRRSPAARPAAQRLKTGHFFAANGCAHAISRRPRHRGRT